MTYFLHSLRDFNDLLFKDIRLAYLNEALEIDSF